MNSLFIDRGLQGHPFAEIHAEITFLNIIGMLVFFGSDQFSVHACRALMRSLPAPMLCVTLPGTFRQYAQSQSGYQVVDWQHFKERVEQFDCGVVASFGRIIPARVIGRFARALLNVHPSLLPRLRGPAPIQRTLMLADCADIGVSIIDVHPTIVDGGDIYAQKAVSAPQDISFERAAELLGTLGGDLAAQVVLDPDPSKAPQNPDLATYAPKVTRQDALIDLSKMTGPHIWALYRAIGHQETLYLPVGRYEVLLRDVTLGDRSDLVVGQVARHGKDLYLGCRDQSSIIVRECSLRGKSTVLPGVGLLSALHLKSNQNLIF
jgi:methionyl-tRNA formyltransferase